MERQIPGGIPRILPFVRHGDNVTVEQMRPFTIAAVATRLRRRRLVRIAADPVLNGIMIKLFAHQQTSERLAGDVGFF